jgi:hypothetical protein
MAETELQSTPAPRFAFGPQTSTSGDKAGCLDRDPLRMCKDLETIIAGNGDKGDAGSVCSAEGAQRMACPIGLGNQKIEAERRKVIRNGVHIGVLRLVQHLRIAAALIACFRAHAAPGALSSTGKVN